MGWLVAFGIRLEAQVEVAGASSSSLSSFLFPLSSYGASSASKGANEVGEDMDASRNGVFSGL